MSGNVTPLLKAALGLLIDKARDCVAKKLKDGDATDQKVGELIQREIDDIKSKLDAMSRENLLNAIDHFGTGLRHMCLALDIDYASVTINGPAITSAIEQWLRNVEIADLRDEEKQSLVLGERSFRLAREHATRASNNEALDTVPRITAFRYRVMAAMLESVANSLTRSKDLSSLSPAENALRSATPECEQSLHQLHSLPRVKKNFEAELELSSSRFNNIKGRFGQYKRREIICAVCQMNRFIYDARIKFNFDHYLWSTIEIGDKLINPLNNRKVTEVLEKFGMQNNCIEWSLGQSGEEGHTLKLPSRIATNTYGEFLVVDIHDKTIKVFDSSGEFIYKINPQVDDTVTNNLVSDVATDVNNNTYILVFLSESGTDRHEVQVFTKTEMCKKFPVRDDSFYLTVSHDRVFVASRRVIVVYDLNGIPVGRVGEGTLSYVRDIAAGSDGQIFVLNYSWGKHKIVYVFTEDGHQHNNFRVDSAQGDDPSLQLASYPSSEHIVVFSGFELTTRRLKLAMYRKDGVFNRLVTLAEKVYNVNGIAVTNDGSVAISILDQEDQRKVIVRPMKPY
ncbi:PREDICTED: uncharacterized protein LOC107350222 isoform X2 [Acropora digitifera]|uniref:uncharacterized protein LOC107350222 isoform X2 n=1 Tax=Acropora digitifera TaxID=70779 RepID=UPI00077A0940|nr:PREDICTED: uncharacterized protein LOC107350222 isoform X2 [Acropora digitifera]